MARRSLYAFLTANFVSLVGNNLTMIAVPWFVLETTGSPLRTGLVAFFTALPSVFAAFFGGTLVDRLGHKRMSILSDLASGFTVALIPLLYLLGSLEYWQLLVLVFLSALLDAPGNTARQAILPDVAEASRWPLERANAAQQVVQRAGVFVGPVCAGLLIVAMGSANVLWLDAASFGISALLFALAVPARRSGVRLQERYFDQLRAGLQFVRKDRLILALLATVTVTNFLDAPVFAVILPVYAKEIFGRAPSLGWMVAGFGAGAALGSLLFGTLTLRLPRRLTFVVSFVLVSGPFWTLALKPPLGLAIAALFLGGVAAGQLNPLIMTVAQERVPADLRGRVFGITMGMSLVAAPLGMLVAGALTEVVGVTDTVLIVAISYLAVTLAQFGNAALHEMDAVGQTTG